MSRPPLPAYHPLLPEVGHVVLGLGGKGSGPKGALSARGPVPVPKLPTEQHSKAGGGGEELYRRDA